MNSRVSEMSVWVSAGETCALRPLPAALWDAASRRSCMPTPAGGRSGAGGSGSVVEWLRDGFRRPAPGVSHACSTTSLESRGTAADAPLAEGRRGGSPALPLTAPDPDPEPGSVARGWPSRWEGIEVVPLAEGRHWGRVVLPLAAPDVMSISRWPEVVPLLVSTGFVEVEEKGESSRIK